MTKPRKTMFPPKSADASAAPDALPATITDAAAVHLAVPIISSHQWETKFIPMIEAKIADAQRRKTEAEEQLSLGEMSSLFGKVGASQLVVEFREAVRLSEIEIASLQSARQRAHAEKEKALKREAAVLADQEIYRAQQIAKAQIELAAKFDQCAAALGVIAEKIWANVNALGPLQHRHGFGRERLISSYAARGAIRAAGLGLHKLLGLDELPPHQREHLSSVEKRKFDRLLSIPTAAGDAEKRKAAIIDQVEADHPELAITLGVDTEDEVEKKMDRLGELVAERLADDQRHAA
jgi:hypothetical protein